MKRKSASWHFARVLLLVGCGIPAAADAATAAGTDYVYIHCRSSGGDFRISELNHALWQFSDRYQQYRPVCRNCDITEWGNRIAMADGLTTVVLIDRLSGDVSVRRLDASEDAGVNDVHSFHGTCAKGSMVVPKAAPPAPAGRIF